MMLDVLFCHLPIVTLTDDRPMLENGFLGVQGGRIAYLSEIPPAVSVGRRIEGGNRVLMPGLVNAHTHLAMTLLRGYADDLPLMDWLDKKIFPAEAKLTYSAVKAGSLLAVAELIAAGVTCCVDMYDHTCAVAEAVFEGGIKATLSHGGVDLCPPELYNPQRDTAILQAGEMLSSWHGADNGRIRAGMSIHAEYTSYPAQWRARAAFAAKHDLAIYMHLSETEGEQKACIEKYGKTPTEAFLEAGVLDVPAHGAHGVWLTGNDMEILAAKGASVIHNPVSNLKLASGIARVSEMRQKGVGVSLGTDGAASNNTLDMFEEIKTAALAGKVKGHDPAALPALEVLKMATRGGAYTAGRQNECGTLKEGMDADLILVDFDRPHLTPCHNVASNLCYSARGSDVVLTMCRGRILYENGFFYTLDTEKILAEAGKWVSLF